MNNIKIILFGVVLGFLLISGATGLFLYKYLHRQKPVPVIVPAEEIKVTIIEGWTVDNIASYLESEQSIPKDNFFSALDDLDRAEFPILRDLPKNNKLEGYLFPDTYRFLKNSSSLDIIKKLISTMEKRYLEAGGKLENGSKQIIPGYEALSLGSGEKGLDIHEILTLASIVEKETGIDLTKLGENQKGRLEEERKIVAGIFLNRLLIGQALESDATINYATGKKQASPTLKDLEINSPYNTYKNNGLPPGPICSPSLSSIAAVLNPIKTNYFYFLHKQPSGEAVYSKTFEEHVQNKFKYLK